jgi:repressor of nif and glnA expression
MDYKKLSGKEGTDLIIKILKEAQRPLSTREIQQETQKRLVRCPDSTIVYLNRLRLKGVINGERRKEMRGWVWWIDD